MILVGGGVMLFLHSCKKTDFEIPVSQESATLQVKDGETTQFR